MKCFLGLLVVTCFDFKLLIKIYIFINNFYNILLCVLFFRLTYRCDNSKGMPAQVFYSNNYDALIASRKLDDTLTNFDLQECNMENQFKLVII